MSLFESIVIAIVEGLTEFLPVSSTAHIIITSRLLGVSFDKFMELYAIAVQLGAILAVVVVYRKKFFDFSNLKFYLKLIVGVLPALLIGFFWAEKIDALLESATTIAVALILGGVVLLFIDKLFAGNTIGNEQQVTYKRAFFIGIWQCLAMIPGVSRSASSIIGGMQQKLTKAEAAEFSFFLAVPTLFAATGYKLYRYFSEQGDFTKDQWTALIVGNIAAFIVALLAIKFFIGFVKRYGFKIWGIYRIIIGVILLLLIFFNFIEA